MAKIGRNAGSGRFTSVKKAKSQPKTHVVETIKRGGKKKWPPAPGPGEAASVRSRRDRTSRPCPVPGVKVAPVRVLGNVRVGATASVEGVGPRAQRRARPGVP